MQGGRIFREEKKNKTKKPNTHTPPKKNPTGGTVKKGIKYIGKQQD